VIHIYINGELECTLWSADHIPQRNERFVIDNVGSFKVVDVETHCAFDHNKRFLVKKEVRVYLEKNEE